MRMLILLNKDVSAWYIITKEFWKLSLKAAIKATTKILLKAAIKSWRENVFNWTDIEWIDTHLFIENTINNSQKSWYYYI